MGFRQYFYKKVLEPIILVVAIVMMAILETIVVPCGVVVGLIIDHYPRWAKYPITKKLADIFDRIPD